MDDKSRRRLRFSVKSLFIVVTLLCVGLGGWITFSNYKLRRLTKLRAEGAIVIFRDRTPRPLQAIGITHLHPFYSIPTVELYVTPQGSESVVGNNEVLVPNETARRRIIEMASEARSCGANDIHLITLDGFDPEWFRFANENSLTVIGESKNRYLARLKANQEPGANINP
jgi:hypothetical protein